MVKWIIVVVAMLAAVSFAELRTWKLNSGETVEAEYDGKALDDIWLKSADGKRIKVPKSQLTQDDLTYLELVNPPRLKLEFSRKSSQRLNYYKGTPHLPYRPPVPPSVFEYVFTANVTREDKVPYRHELTIIYYAIGQQKLDQDKYILLEEKSEVFNPSESGEISVSGQVIRMREYDFQDQPRGRKFSDYLIVVIDERGEIIAHKESAPWLFTYYDQLRKLPVGAYMDDTCTRVHPTGPEPTY